MEHLTTIGRDGLHLLRFTWLNFGGSRSLPQVIEKSQASCTEKSQTQALTKTTVKSWSASTLGTS